MEKSSVLRFIFVVVFIGVLSVPLTYFSVKKLLSDHSHIEHRNGYSIGVRIQRNDADHTYGDSDDSIQSHDTHFHQHSNPTGDLDFTSNVAQASNQHRGTKKKHSKTRATAPYIYLTEKMRYSIDSRLYASHTVACFDQLSKRFYLCDNRIENAQLSCPIIYPDYKIQIISDNHEVYQNITRDTTACFILWFDNNQDGNSLHKITVDDVLTKKQQKDASSISNPLTPTTEQTPYRTNPHIISGSASKESKK